jgi:hypothetical protein
MLTGKRAFRKGTSAETLSALLNEEPLPLAQSVQNFPPSSPPGQILAPSISPDESRSRISIPQARFCLTGNGRRIAPDDGGEGRSLAAMVAGRKPAGVRGSRRFAHIHILDLRTGRSSLVPRPAGM